MTTSLSFHGIDSPIELMGELGFKIDPVKIDLDDWRHAGVDLGLPSNAQFHRVLRIGDVVFFTLGGLDDPDRASEVVRRLSVFNKVENYLVIYYNHKLRLFTVLFIDRDRRLHRLEVDPERPRADALQRLNLLVAREIGSDVGTLKTRLAAVFDRNALARQFFERFRAACANLSGEIAKSCGHEESSATRDQAMLMLSRILFLYFLEKKSWLNGEPRFLANRFESAVAEGRNFYSTVLEPLFFGCLNTPVKDRSADCTSLGAIPYLNGGLFERSPYEQTEVVELSNECFFPIIRDLFERFAFSVDESDMAGVHIDPEMLGMVFESLMEKDERARSGTFYTPRPIVHRIVSRAISSSVAWDDDDLKRAVDRCLEGDVALGIDKRSARRLRGRLQQLRVIDIACGSGAFLLTALQLIERLIRLCDGRCGTESSPWLRRRIVEESLFGVDLKSEAVRLCELRLWLAIVSDPNGPEDRDVGAIPPLPNLDRNIRQGNSLLGPLDFLGGGRRDIYRDWSWGIRRTAELVDRFRCAGPNEKPELARAIRESDQRLAAALVERSITRDEAELNALGSQEQLFKSRSGQRVERQAAGQIRSRIEESRRNLQKIRSGDLEFFAFDVHFASIIEAGGFDIVVGNPPWVRMSKIGPALRSGLAERYRTFGGRGLDQSDLSLAFVERAMTLARKGGVVAQLVPSKIASSRYGERMRQWILRDHSVIAIDDWSISKERLFTADTFPMALTLRSGPAGGECVRVARNGESWCVKPAELSVHEEGPWLIVPTAPARLIRDIERRFRPLQDVVRRTPLMGVKTGSNRRFFLPDLEIDGDSARVGSSGIEIPLSAICRCVRGRDVRSWQASDSTWMLWPPARGWNDPPAWARALAKSTGLDSSRFRLSYVRPEHLGIKVAWKDVSRGLQAVVLPESVRVDCHEFPLVPNQTLYSIETATLDEAYFLSAVLNSTVFNALAVAYADPAKDLHARYYGRLVASIPLPELDREPETVRALIRLARRAHQGKVALAEIDGLVNGLYGLSDLESNVIGSWLHERLVIGHGK